MDRTVKPEPRKRAAVDPFAAAEMAAAIEAVDEVDMEVGPDGEERAVTEPAVQAAEVEAEVVGEAPETELAAETEAATAETELAAETEAATAETEFAAESPETEPTPDAAVAGETEAEAAVADAEDDAASIKRAALEAELLASAAEAEAAEAEAEASRLLDVERDALADQVEQAELARVFDAHAADAEAQAAVAAVEGFDDADPEAIETPGALDSAGSEPAARAPASASQPAAQDDTTQSEEEAEAAALREALAFVLGGEVETAPADPDAGVGGGSAGDARLEDESAADEAPDEAGDASDSPPTGSELDAQTEPENKRRKGLLGRLRGS